MHDAFFGCSSADGCLVELPVFNPWELWAQSKLGAGRPALEPDAWIHHDGDSRQEPVGIVCSAPGDARQVYIPIVGRELKFSRARYLINPAAEFKARADGKPNPQPFSKLKPHDKAIADIFGGTPSETEIARLQSGETALRQSRAGFANVALR